MREEIQMHNALSVIDSFNNQVPLHLHLKNYFREHKNMGSRDRKILSALVFGYYRMKGKNHASSKEKFIVKGAEGNLYGNQFYVYWKDKFPWITDEAMIDFKNYFPLAENVSSQIDKASFYQTHLVQPKVWIRCKKGKEKEVMAELRLKEYEFQHSDKSIISFEKSYPLDQLECFSKGFFEIQDIASQKVSTILHPHKNESWWDCCAGSGGKSLLLLEEEPQIQLFISDNRSSILNNLRERFDRSGIRNYHIELADLTKKESLKRFPEFDNILADVPCSGSGTWTRSPEWLSYFSAHQLENFVGLQQTIISNAIEKLKPGGNLIYITCSVYADENEKQVETFIRNLSLELIESAYFQYAAAGGDTMYAARLKKKD